MSRVSLNEQGVKQTSLDSNGDTLRCQINECNDIKSTSVGESCIHELFEAQAERTPNAVALEFEESSLSYRQLNERANQVAHFLRGLGTGPDVLVGLCVERSLDSIVGLLGILKAGGGYVPLDPAYPLERLSVMLADADAKVLLTHEAVRPRLPVFKNKVISLDGDWPHIAKEAVTNPELWATIDNLAYVIYTSGSTGKPKGVAVSHKPMTNLTNWQINQSDIGAGGKTLQLTSLSFDVSVQEIFATLCNGGTLVLIPEHLRRDAKALVELIARELIERIFLPFSPLQQLAETALRERITPNSLREIVTAGEQLRITPQLIKFFQQLSNCTLYNQYGPTETHVVVTSYPLRGEPEQWPELPPIGRPLINTYIYILDEQLQLAPTGVVGELHIGGVCLARGYLNQPALTNERFINDPFSADPQARLYRSGDLGRYLPDGSIEFIGRIDGQVKIRGFRIELGEVETVLNQHPCVSQTAVVASEDAVGDRRLVAYIVFDPAQKASTSELRQFMLLRLPDYMVPSVFIGIDSLPLTPSGKLDRKALPLPGVARPTLDNNFCPPQTEIEQALTEFWQGVLGLDQVGGNDNLFELGGDSLKATRVLARLDARYHLELSLKALFETPTIAEIAKRIEAMQTAITSIQPQACLPQEPGQFGAIAFGQQGIWLDSQIQKTEPIYNESFTIHIKEFVNVAALERAFQAFIQRHDMLRAGFTSMNGMVSQSVSGVVAFHLAGVDLTSMDKDARAACFAAEAGVVARRHFDLTQPPLLRATLYRIGEEDYILHLVFHHIICDAQSVYDVLLPEIYTLYRAFSNDSKVELDPPPLNYRDYVFWQQTYLQGEAINRDRSYWENQLAGIRLLELPTDYHRSPQLSHRGAFKTFSISKESSDALTGLSQQEGVTMYMLLLAAFNVLLWRYTAQDDIVIGTVKADRQRQEFESLFGYFLNTLVIRTDLAGNPRFTDLLQRTRDTTLDAFAHCRYPFIKLIEHFQAQKDLTRHPLFQVAFVMEPSLAEHPSGWTVSQREVQHGTAKYELTMELEQRSEGIIGRLEYCTDLFENTTIERMIRHFRTLLEGIVENPVRTLSDLPLMSDVECRQQLVEWNNTMTPYPRDKCIHQLFEEMVEQSPGSIGVIDVHRTLTYRDLNSQANRLAHYLRDLGVGPNVLVGLCMQRSIDLVIAILGILKAGGAYVPLDPNYPLQRLAFMLEDTKAPVLVTETRLLRLLPSFQGHLVCMDTEWSRIEQGVSVNPLNLTKAQDFAYVMYTSGSTGTPKGVIVPHRGVVRLVRETQYIKFGPEQTFLLLAPISFDASTFELWGALLHGAKCVVFADHVPSLQSLGRVIREQKITTLWLTAALFNAVIDESPEILIGVHQLLTGGETLSLPHVCKALERLPETRLFNGYGPTESTTFACCYPISRQIPDSFNSIPIGTPISHTQVYILDAYMKPVPIGVPGELYIGGDGLACGYLDRPELTAERFIATPFSSEFGTRLYKTGDRVRYLADGNIEFLGRFDEQLKIRGYRIEPGEINAALTQHPSVSQAAVIALSEANIQGQRLVAYVVSNSTDTPSPDKLKEFLKLRLPDYMVPSEFLFLDSLPLTPNGKLDRRALPLSTVMSGGVGKTRVAPRNAIEVQLMRIWEQLLGVSPVGMEDNFFDLGGHSLLAVQLIDRIKQLFDRELPLNTLWYGRGTIEHLAQMLIEEDSDPIWFRPIAIKPSGNKPPLFCLPIAGGHLFNYDNMAPYIDRERPLYGLPLQGIDGKQPVHTSIEAMAAHCIQLMRTIQPSGPYYLTGYCSGGVIAFEMARQLDAHGDVVAFLGLIDSVPPNSSSTISWMLQDLCKGKNLRLVQERFYALVLNAIRLPQLRKLKGVGESHRWALWSYRPQPFSGRITVFRPASYEYSSDKALGWSSLTGDGVEVHLLPGQHRDLVKEPGVQRLAERLNQCMAAASQKFKDEPK
ncbi:MAG: amino acid adenylation domain-containing protein [Gammaproteobacteria bacterium]